MGYGYADTPGLAKVGPQSNKDTPSPEGRRIAGYAINLETASMSSQIAEHLYSPNACGKLQAERGTSP